MGLIIAAALSAGFFAGVWVGQFVWGTPGERAGFSRWTGSSGQVLVEGRLSYRPDPLTGRPDDGAVVIFLPADRTPKETIPVSGLRPFETANSRAAGPQAIAKLGGVVERTDAAGQFMLVVPPGSYYVLLVSRHARRPKGEPVRPSDLASLRKYIYAAEDLIGEAKYHWQLYQFTAGKNNLDHNFGLDEGERTFDPLEGF
jgi:hypothetical protein